jgi:serine/threonine protein kinase
MASPVSEIVRTNDVPDKIGKYVIINKIGKGSTGMVYLSHDPYYRRDVAIKVYNIEEDTDPSRASVSRKMFFNEAHMVGMLQHPNIMPIYDAGEEDGKYYVVTEHIQGARTLAAYCRPDNLLRIDDVVEIVYKCAKALHYSHGRGVIHRDIKPSNVMLTIDNDVRIIDFGIAIVSDSEVSRIEGIAGSPSYMSPEQVQSEDLTPRSDLYSLGAVMYELLTGFRPFRADNLSKLLHQIVYATPPPIHTYRDDLPEELEQVVAMTMQKLPEKRIANGNAMAADLTRVYQDLRQKYDSLDNQEHFDLLRTLTFFHEFSHAEIWEVLRASDWHEYRENEDIVKEGEIDDRFYIIVAGGVTVQANGNNLGQLGSGDCFGETSYVRGAKRQASIRAVGAVTILRVSSTLMEQV